MFSPKRSKDIQKKAQKSRFAVAVNFQIKIYWKKNKLSPVYVPRPLVVTAVSTFYFSEQPNSFYEQQGNKKHFEILFYALSQLNKALEYALTKLTDETLWKNKIKYL